MLPQPCSQLSATVDPALTAPLADPWRTVDRRARASGGSQSCPALQAPRRPQILPDEEVQLQAKALEAQVAAGACACGMHRAWST